MIFKQAYKVVIRGLIRILEEVCKVMFIYTVHMGSTSGALGFSKGFLSLNGLIRFSKGSQVLRGFSTLPLTVTIRVFGFGVQSCAFWV